MPIKATVLYPNDDDIKFDMDYYLSKHMPLVDKHWKQYGLKHWEVTQFDEGLGGAKPQYKIQAVLTFDSPEQIQKAVTSEEAKEVFGDVPHFTNKQPIFMSGGVTGTS